MGLKICSIASGSTGNCIYVASDSTAIIIDEGVPVSRVETSLKLLGADIGNISLLVTHTHSDHVSNLPAFIKRNPATVYASFESAAKLKKNAPLTSKNFVEFGDGDFVIGDIAVTPIKVSHDIPCVGYSFYHKGQKISVMTDLGYVGNTVFSSLLGSDLVLIESNHDENLVRVNDKYQSWLKSRILSRNGHLSNNACADTVAKLALKGVKQFILGHLSRENNYPELAFNTAKQKLEEFNIKEGKDVFIEVALHNRMTGLYEII